MLLSDLTPNIKNPRKITDEKLQMLEASLKEFGDLSGFIFNRKLGRLEGGHQRQKVMPPDAEVIIEQKFDEPTATGTVALGKVLWNGEKYAYREVEWDEPKSLAANVAANKHGGDWDLPALEQIMLTLDENNIDLSLTGFGEEEIKDLFDWKDEPVAGLTDDDAIPENVETRCQPGQLWMLGNHRLLCGDSTKIEDVDRLMNGEKADMVFTDPPYEIQTVGGGLFQESSAMKKIKQLGIDSFDPSTLVSLADTSVFCCNKPLIPDYIKLANDWGVAWDIAVYHKQNITPNYGGHLMTDLEYLMVIGKQAPRTGLGEDKDLYSKLFSGGKDQDNKTAWSKPVALCEKFIKLYSQHSVIDIFGGSGSTLIACQKTNRRCFMMEIDPHYCDVIIQRWEQFTGKTAVLQT